MSEIPRPQATDAVTWPHHGNSGGRRSPYEQYQQAAGENDGSPAMMPTDDLSALSEGFLNLPPAVHKIVQGLVVEQEGLRQTILQNEGRISFLEQLSDQHAYMPVLNRRAILREVSAFTHQPQTPYADSTAAIGAVALFYLVNFEKLHRHNGLIEAEDALIHLARQIAGAVRASDRVGSVGGAGLLVLMPGASLDGARARITQLLETLSMRVLTLRDGLVSLTVRAAVMPLQAGDEGEQALAAVDELLRTSLAAENLL